MGAKSMESKEPTGAMISPKKGMKEQQEEASMSNNERRRKRLNDGVVEGGWGELQTLRAATINSTPDRGACTQGATRTAVEGARFPN